MTERYAFRYTEYLVQQAEKEKIFAVKGNLPPLLTDVQARLQGIDFQKGKSPLEKLGIRVNENISNASDILALTDSYGADAIRLALLEGLPLTDENLTGYWRFVGNLWVCLKTKKTDEKLSNPPFAIYQAFQNNDFTAALIALKTFLKQTPPVCDELFKLIYPFMPHLVQSFVPDIHSKMGGFWKEVQKTLVPNRFFIELNGKKVMDFYPISEQKEKIIEEALSFLPIQNKIGQNKVQKVIFIPKKGVNFVV